VYACCVFILVFCRSYVLFASGDLGGDVSGFGFKGGKDAVAFAAGGFEVGGSERKAVAYGDAFGVPERDPAPPGAVVVPDVVIGVVFGAAGGEAKSGFGHGLASDFWARRG
jgi:hypothetical protein